MAERDRRRIAAVLAADADLEILACALRPRAVPISTSSPTPDWSIDTNGSTSMIPVCGVVGQDRRGVVARQAEAGLRQVVGAEREELRAGLAARRSPRRAGTRAAARSSCRPDRRAWRPSPSRPRPPSRRSPSARRRTPSAMRRAGSSPRASPAFRSSSPNSPPPRRSRAPASPRSRDSGSQAGNRGSPSIGLISCSSAMRSASRFAGTPSAFATLARSSAPCGRNSCSGGSSSRIVTGIPAMISNSALEVAALHRQDLGERRAAALLVVGADHLAHRENAVLLEEHVLGAAQADALRAELAAPARHRAAYRHWRARRAGAPRRPSPSACRSRPTARAGASPPGRRAPAPSRRRW